jgi:hypothetical protein
MDWGTMKWYRISGYNGYEYNFDHKIVRSIKNYKVNPMGKLIKKYSDTKGDFYKMSNMQNEVCKVYVSEIEDIIKNDPHKVAMATNETNLSPRNTVTRKKYRNADNDPSKDTFFPDFSDLIEG